MRWLFASGGQSIRVSASASVLPMNTQDWSPLGWTGWISLQSKGLSRVFSNTTVQKYQFFSSQLYYSPTLTSIHDYWKNHAAAAAAAKSLQSCPTLCDPIDGNPLQYTCLENPMDQGAWQASVHRVLRCSWPDSSVHRVTRS